MALTLARAARPRCMRWSLTAAAWRSSVSKAGKSARLAERRAGAGDSTRGFPGDERLAGDAAGTFGDAEVSGDALEVGERAGRTGDALGTGTESVPGEEAAVSPGARARARDGDGDARRRAGLARVAAEGLGTGTSRDSASSARSRRAPASARVAEAAARRSASGVKARSARITLTRSWASVADRSASSRSRASVANAKCSLRRSASASAVASASSSTPSGAASELPRTLPPSRPARFGASDDARAGDPRGGRDAEGATTGDRGFILGALRTTPAGEPSIPARGSPTRDARRVVDSSCLKATRVVVVPLAGRGCPTRTKSHLLGTPRGVLPVILAEVSARLVSN